MENSALSAHKARVLVVGLLLVSTGWGFTTDQELTIGGTGTNEQRDLTVTGVLKIGAISEIAPGTADGIVTSIEKIQTDGNSTDNKIPTTEAVKAYVHNAFGISS